MTPVHAARAYQLMGQAASSLAPQKVPAEAPDFGKMVGDVVGSVVDSGRKSDAAAASAVAGSGDIIDVVTAISETEMALQTLVSVRDRVISSYEEIMRMPI